VRGQRVVINSFLAVGNGESKVAAGLSHPLARPGCQALSQLQVEGRQRLSLRRVGLVEHEVALPHILQDHYPKAESLKPKA
jgi:hypothetical protein